MDRSSSVGASVFVGGFLVARDLAKDVNTYKSKPKSKPKTKSSCVL